MIHCSIALTCVGILAGIQIDLFAADAPPADAQAQIQTLRKELNDLQRQRDELKQTLEKADSLATLRKLRDQTAEEYKTLEKNDTAIKDAQKVQQEASDAFDKLIVSKVTGGAEGVELAKQSTALEDKRHDLQLQDAIAQLKLQNPHSPIQRALDKDAQLAELRKAYQAMDREKKQERDAARAKYEQARDARLAQMPEAKALSDERAKIKESLAGLDKQAQEIHVKSRDLREKIRAGTDPDVVAAKQKMSVAQKAVSAARDAEKISAAREAAYNASRSLRDKVSELADADPKGKELKDAIAAKMQQLSELQKKAKKP